MIVYHGSDVIVTDPDVEHSFRPLDFGKGFYVTTVKEQAERWAKRKVANDKVFRVVDMYHSGIWDKERALKEIKVYHGYDQIAFITKKAMDIYYSSKLSDKIYLGKEGIQYLDYKVLVQILMETEEELFEGELGSST